MHLHINHSTYFKYLTSFAGASIAIVETANIIDHSLHPHFPLVRTILLCLIALFIIGLFVTYKNQKAPDRIRERIKNKFEKWEATQSGKFRLGTTDLLNVKAFPELTLKPGFTDFLEASKKANKDESFFQRLLPVLNILLLVGFLGMGFYFYTRLAKVTGTIEKDLPEFLQLIKEGKPGLAYYRGKKILGSDPENKIVLEGLKGITTTVDLETVEPSVEVYLQLSEADQEWEKLGVTPLKKINLPNGAIKLKFIDPKKNEFLVTAVTYFISAGENLFELPPSMPDTTSMALVIGGKTNIFLAGLDSKPAVRFSPYLIDKKEVTNEAYKKFVDAGGYKDPSFWDNKLEQLKSLLVDKTGFPGPSTWVNGTYPEGKGNYPVNGLSWYEANAYAKFTGKKLPSSYQWAKAATPTRSAILCPASNFTKSETGAVPYAKAVSGYGLYDVAGNVREWCSNPAKEDLSERAILGGGFDDEPYAFNDYYAQNVLDRSPTNGMRLVRELNPNDSTLYTELIKKPFRDFLKVPKIDRQVFDIYKRQYEYEKKPLDAVMLKKENDDPDYTYELVEFNTAYNNERMSGILFKPKNATGKVPAIIHFPGSNVIHTTDIEKITLGQIHRSFIKLGYALFYPIYKGTVNRQDGLKSDYADESDSYKEHVIKWGKDMRRSIDWMETRADLDLSNLIYFGYSWGGQMGNIMIPIESRIKRAVLLVAGLEFEESQPEVEACLYTPFIKVPVLMLNGKYDYFFPSETSQKPMFELIGTGKNDKYWYLYESSHNVPVEEFIKETKRFLDKYSK